MPDPSALPALADTTAAGDGQELAWGPWHVPGIFGIINNIFAVCFMTFVWFFALWPPQTPVDAATMNYASLMTGGVTIFSIVYYWLWAHKEYKGPRVEVREG